MPTERSVARLVIGSRRFRCTVLNVSIGGFGVEAPNHSVIAEAENALLQTREGVFPVRIVHTSEINGKLSVGLLRIEATDKETAREQAQRQRRLSLALTGTIVLFFGGTLLLIVSADRTPDSSPAAWWGPLTSRSETPARRTREGSNLSSTAGFHPAALSNAPGRVNRVPYSVAPSTGTFRVHPSATVRLSGSEATSLAAVRPSAATTAGKVSGDSTALDGKKTEAHAVASHARNNTSARAVPPATTNQPARVHFTAAVTKEVERLSDAAHRNPRLRTQAETLNQLLTEAARNPTTPSGQMRTVARDGVRVDYRGNRGVVEIVRVQIAATE